MTDINSLLRDEIERLRFDNRILRDHLKDIHHNIIKRINEKLAGKEVHTDETLFLDNILQSNMPIFVMTNGVKDG